MPSSAVDRFKDWVTREAPAAPLAHFRVAFGAIWLSYDVLDLLLGGTAHCHDWLAIHPPPGLVGLQVGLILCELVLVLGQPAGFAMPVTLLAALLRGMEWWNYLRLNDFAYFTVTAVILAHARPTAGLLLRSASGASGRAPRWPRDVLVLQLDLLRHGAHEGEPDLALGAAPLVRLEYLQLALGWHFPGIVSQCADSLACDSVLAMMGIVGEVTLALLLVFRPRRLLVTPLVLGIHAFGALGTNVWFFGPSLIAQVVLLTGPEFVPSGTLTTNLDTPAPSLATHG